MFGFRDIGQRKFPSALHDELFSLGIENRTFVWYLLHPASTSERYNTFRGIDDSHVSFEDRQASSKCILLFEPLSPQLLVARGFLVHFTETTLPTLKT